MKESAQLKANKPDRYHGISKPNCLCEVEKNLKSMSLSTEMGRGKENQQIWSGLAGTVWFFSHLRTNFGHKHLCQPSTTLSMSICRPPHLSLAPQPFLADVS